MGRACSAHGIKVTLIYSFGRKPSKTIDNLEIKHERKILNCISEKQYEKERTELGRPAMPNTQFLQMAVKNYPDKKKL
jgi:hypothetical protein